ncbi:hypothetical protein KTT_30770 [Tengunoibacter tsumagoiensis]|uniref:Uncharacterized protein n=1 Tax=Tengunoibacter tsumagoiensis TaxID=2014871 RepID=A0A402A232_9CHLR|nr:hypothetical protein KTT_30770 [Tengunoibacter tsumagoiensis]
MVFGKLDNASADLMGKVFIVIGYLVPQSRVILLFSGNDSRSLAIACNNAKLPFPKAGYPFATLEKAGGKDRTCGSLHRADGDVVA